MLIGVPKEIKVREYRVGMVPSSVRELTHHGHEVLIEKNAGEGIGASDDDYIKAGAKIAETADEIFEQAEMIVKVKEPQPEECKKLREGQILFTYLHLAPDPEQTKLLKESGCIAIAYETVTDKNGGLPLLAPMSEVAGRMSIQAGARSLEKNMGGRGMLLGGVPGVEPAKVVIIGGGVVGTNAAKIAIGMGANVVILDKSLPRLRELDNIFGTKITTVCANKDAIERHVTKADLTIGAVLVPGDSAPKLISRELLKNMRKGSVIVDVAIDQGGCAETSRPTTHDTPTFEEEGVIHYCVANMPGAVARTSAFALNNATLPFIVKLADKGLRALKEDEHLLNGLNVYKGQITYQAVAHALGYPYTPASSCI